MESGLLASIDVEPENGARSAVIWLHGLGADGSDFEPIVPFLGLDPRVGARFVFPHAPPRAVTVNGGMIMPAWYDIRSLSLRREADEQGLEQSAEQIRALIARENARGIPSERIVLAGFSQGGALALHVGLRHPEALAGIVALSCYLVAEESLEKERSRANRGVPIFQAHGTDDPMVPLEAGRAARDRLRELGYSTEWKTYPMQHQVHPQEIRDIGRMLDRVLSVNP